VRRTREYFGIKIMSVRPYSRSIETLAGWQIKLHKREIKFAKICSPISGSPTPTLADSFRHSIIMGCFLSCILSPQNTRRKSGSAFKPRRRPSRLFTRRSKKPGHSTATTDSQEPESPNNTLSESSPLLRPKQASPQSRRPAFLTRPLSRGRETPKVRVIPATPETEQVLIRAAKGKQVPSNSSTNGVGENR
jgi:hypothetical protein